MNAKIIAIRYRLEGNTMRKLAGNILDHIKVTKPQVKIRADRFQFFEPFDN